MAENKKLSEVAKLLKITGKEMMSKMAEYGVELKSLSSVMTEEQISLAFDVFTQLNNTDEAEVIKEKAAAVAAKDQKTDSKSTEKKSVKKKEQPKKDSYKNDSVKKEQKEQNNIDNNINKEKLILKYF